MGNDAVRPGRACPADGGSGRDPRNAARGAKAALNAQSTLQRPYTTKAGGKKHDVGLSGNENKCSGACADAAGRYSRRVCGRKRSHDACFRAADGNADSESSPAEAFQASRDCILLAAAYLFGTLMAGVLQALCDAEEMETLAIIWTAGAECSRRPVPRRRWDCLGQSWLSSSGRRQCSSCWGSRQWGRCPSFCLRCYTGQAPACSSAQLLNSFGAKQLVLFLLTASLPTALAAGALCLFGASALQVSSRIHAFSFGRGDRGNHPAGARLLVGQFALLAVCLCPLCGAATGLVCLANRLMQAG